MPWRPFVQAVREAKTVQQVAHPADRSTALCSAEPCSQLLKENWSPQIPFFSFMQFLLLFVHMRTIYSVQKVRYWRVFSNPARFDRVPAKYAVSRSERRARPHCSLEHNAMVYLLPALSSFRFSISPVAFGWRHCGTLTHTGGVSHKVNVAGVSTYRRTAQLTHSSVIASSQLMVFVLRSTQSTYVHCMGRT